MRLQRISTLTVIIGLLLVGHTPSQGAVSLKSLFHWHKRTPPPAETSAKPASPAARQPVLQQDDTPMVQPIRLPDRSSSQPIGSPVSARVTVPAKTHPQSTVQWNPYLQPASSATAAATPQREPSDKVVQSEKQRRTEKVVYESTPPLVRRSRRPPPDPAPKPPRRAMVPGIDTAPRPSESSPNRSTSVAPAYPHTRAPAGGPEPVRQQTPQRKYAKGGDAQSKRGGDNSSNSRTRNPDQPRRSTAWTASPHAVTKKDTGRANRAGTFSTSDFFRAYNFQGNHRQMPLGALNGLSKTSATVSPRAALAVAKQNLVMQQPLVGHKDEVASHPDTPATPPQPAPAKRATPPRPLAAVGGTPVRQPVALRRIPSTVAKASAQAAPVGVASAKSAERGSSATGPMAPLVDASVYRRTHASRETHVDVRRQQPAGGAAQPAPQGTWLAAYQKLVQNGAGASTRSQPAAHGKSPRRIKRRIE